MPRNMLPVPGTRQATGIGMARSLRAFCHGAAAFPGGKIAKLGGSPKPPSLRAKLAVLRHFQRHARTVGETVTIRNNDHRPGTGTAEVVAQVVNGLPTSKRPAGTNSLTRLGTATPVCDCQGGPCPCCWLKSRGRGVRRTGHKVIGCYRQPAPGASHAMPVRWGDGDNP
jgi:hypothetical protein